MSVGGHFIKSGAKEIEVSMTVIRKDGRREDRGVVNYWHRNPLRRAWWKFRQHWRGIKQ